MTWDGTLLGIAIIVGVGVLANPAGLLSGIAAAVIFPAVVAPVVGAAAAVTFAWWLFEMSGLIDGATAGQLFYVLSAVSGAFWAWGSRKARTSRRREDPLYHLVEDWMNDGR